MPVFLKKIELFGFKSFPDRTKIELTSPITGIVGPNGSGKSNIVDAIRWALGENSAKTLRGDSFEDVIFAGSQYRSSISVAEVNLLFDNSRRILSLPVDEIEITKRYYRSGEGKVFINKKEVRVKDITNLFFGTGLSREGFAIIGQGEVERLVIGTPQEKRSFIDEILGISKVKFRKKEAEKRLAEVNVNIEKLSVILAQSEKEYLELKDHIKKSHLYKTLLQELEKIEKTIIIEKYSNLKRELEKQISEKNKLLELIQNYTEKLEEISREMEKIASDINVYSSVGKEKKSLLEVKEKEFLDVQMKIKDINSKVEMSKRMIELYSKQIQEMEKRKSFLVTEKDRLIERINKSSEEIGFLSSEEQKLTENIKNLEEELSKIEYKRSETYKKINTLKEKANILAITQKDIEHIETNISNLEVSLEENYNTLDILKEKLNIIEREKSELLVKSNNLKDSRKDLLSRINGINEYMRSSEQLLKSLQNNVQTLSKESQKLFDQLSSNMSKNALLVGETLLKISSLANEIVNHSERLLNSFDVEKVAQINTLANSIVQEMSKLKELVGEDSIVAKKKEIDESIIKIREEIDTINKDIISKKDLLSELKSELSTLESNLSMLEKNILSYERESMEIINQMSELERKISNTNSQILSLKQKLYEKVEYISTILKDFDIEVNIENIHDVLHESLRVIENNIHSLSVDELELEREKVYKSLNEIKYLLSNTQRSLSKTMSEMDQMVLQTERIEDELSRLESDIVLKRNEVSAQEDNLKEYSENINKLNIEYEKISKERDILLKEVSENSLILKNLYNLEKEKMTTVNKIKDEEIRINKELHQISEKIGMLEGNISSLEGQFKEKYGTTINDENTLEEDVDIPFLYSRLSALRNELKSLGYVNLEAENNIDEVEKKYLFVKSNYEDLLSTKQKLESMISDINQEISKVVSSSLNEISKTITQVFKDVFGGGYIEIVMENNDFVEGGVEMLVQIPGKKVKNMLLFSGGEKAFISLIFIFSSLLLTDTPLVILDEVDAPLDDENTEKFKKLLKVFEDKTQFILISHNKSTLEICESIYGVTMEEKGVSKIVSYQLSSITH